MTVASAVTVVGSYKQDSVETVKAIQMEKRYYVTLQSTPVLNANRKHTELFGQTNRDKAQTMQGRKNVGKVNILIF